ncbi:hypothetical protein CEXT_743171 [Caerostris extrusa]|uniref:Uncharacterized protein n=1 Tax=Caerostris extrusa TaxID=172846 RepID=A0AAV4T239_CAEEX|nr:hypothetical protein CEXT_743171 [Caerostris extrusa]
MIVWEFLLSFEFQPHSLPLPFHQICTAPTTTTYEKLYRVDIEHFPAESSSGWSKEISSGFDRNRQAGGNNNKAALGAMVMAIRLIYGSKRVQQKRYTAGRTGI